MARGRLRMLRGAVKRTGDGHFVLRLDDEEAALLRSMADQLDPLLDDPSADRGLRRLFPPAHPEDLIAEAEWEIEQGAKLRDARRAALDALRHPVEEPLTEDGLIAWMQGVNSLRLVLAERMEVSGDPDQERATIEAAIAAARDDGSGAEAARQLLGAWQLYELLAWMIDGAVRALGDPGD